MATGCSIFHVDKRNEKLEPLIAQVERRAEGTQPSRRLHYLSRWFTGAGKQSPAGPLQSISQNSRVLFITIRPTVAPSAGPIVSNCFCCRRGELLTHRHQVPLPPRCGCCGEARSESTTHPDPPPLPSSLSVSNIIPTTNSSYYSWRGLSL